MKYKVAMACVTDADALSLFINNSEQHLYNNNILLSGVRIVNPTIDAKEFLKQSGSKEDSDSKPRSNSKSVARRLTKFPGRIHDILKTAIVRLTFYKLLKI